MAFNSETLRVFLAVLDGGSFSSAARQLGRVPSAVSMAIAQLEAELDLELFDRSTRKALPTQAARALEPQARQAARQLNRLDAQALQMHQGLERRLVIAMAPELQSGMWSQPLIDLANEFPLLEVEVRSASQAEAVRLMHEGSVHLALVFERPGIDERENFLEAGSQLLTAVAAPDYLRQMDEQGMVEARQIIVAAGSPSATDPQMILSHHLWLTDSDLATLNLVQAGLGWAYLPHPLVAALIESGNLRTVAFDNMANQLRLWVDIVWSSSRPLGLGARRYLELIRQRMAGQPARG
ncbi:LysR family transcriptional regulator [Pseudomonas chengduensis]|jgi:DNA-binding transcriptional LysR family regulator|uniref:DNA-binding transcriptional regulator, LysR family n=1 Tax=Ectopseudomonas chengduensis TaxID=489632 RepID=A0A1G6L0Y3_9GAMM|nr:MULTISPECIES: LysR family transcriptional regulator [Pseudomonas]KJU77757.1 LysR family transcriptional regulator [Pseudomonas oleovorans]KQO30491.1 LysR family transcriptional regulator [Pseudomonas sp. Leaf83]MBP3061188.1 LysR family transcriptional regulator [Pseudomonas chengduensis]MDH0957340.1 LysR family transcriptional regulator [Pseudomonas chengduensis]MDH1535479.1 LysR family transcriptional regulator [Pseudomonas chengduensis]